MKTFNANQIVKGIRCGFFVILGTRTVGGEFGYQVKAYNPKTGETAHGEFFLTPEALQEC